MIFIAHRGNVSGPSEQENNPSHILEALNMGYHVEIDIWYINNKFILGHNEPQYEVNESFILNGRFWQHAKNIEALYQLNKLKPNYFINCFYHNTDDCVLTSGGWLWTYPGKKLTSDSVAVLPEQISEPYDLQKAYGICSDYVIDYENKLK